MSAGTDPQVATAAPAPRRRWLRGAVILAIAVAAVAVVSTRWAGTGRVFHIAPNGTTGADGTSWSSAGTLADLPDFVERAQPGDEVWIRGDAGAYQTTGPVILTAGGSAADPVVVRGVAADGSDHATPHLIGTRTAPYDPEGNPGTELFKLMAGADHLEFRNLAFANQGNGVFRVGADISDLVVRDMQATNVRRFFENHRSGDARTATITGLQISDIVVNGYSKGAVRLTDATHDVVLRDVVGDSQRQDGDPFAMGVHLSGTVHDVLLERVTMRNSHDTVSGNYWNGDGFAAEGETYDLRFIDTVATGSTDAGYDLKSRGTTLLRAVAQDNKRNYRLWGQAELVDSTGRDPHRRGGAGSQAQVWAGQNARVRIVGCTFTDRRDDTVVFEVDDAADVAVDSTEVSRAPGATEAIVNGDARLRGL